MTNLDGAVAFISGAARGQGRSHAIRLARAGARIIAFDICQDIPEVVYPLASEDDLAYTAELVENEGGEIVTSIADVRDLEQVQAALEAGISRFGRVDIGLANAGILGNMGPTWQDTPESMKAVLDVNVVGVWNVIRAVAPVMIEQAEPAAIVLTASGAGIKGIPNVGSYVASKHAVIGLMKTSAKELAPHGIRVNAVLPGTANTPMVQNEPMMRLHCPDIAEPTAADFAQRSSVGNPFGIPWVEAEDVSEAVLWLVSPEARYITGASVPVDGGTGIP